MFNEFYVRGKVNTRIYVRVLFQAFGSMSSPQIQIVKKCTQPNQSNHKLY